MPAHASIIVLQLLFDNSLMCKQQEVSGVCLGLVMQYACRCAAQIEEVELFTSLCSPGSRFTVTFIVQENILSVH